MFSIVVVPIYIPTYSVGENVNWSHFNQCFLFIDFFFKWWPFWLVWGCSFDFYFLIISDVEQLLVCFLAICMSSLEKYLFRSYAHFFHWVICVFFDIELTWAVFIFWRLIPCRQPFPFWSYSVLKWPILFSIVYIIYVVVTCLYT